MAEGLLYEPRSLWTIANVVATDESQRVRLDKRHLYNGERWPITVKRIALAAINYTLRGTPPEDATADNDTAAALLRMKLSVSVALRFHLNKRLPVLAAGYAPERTAMPPVGLVTVGPDEAPVTYAPSSLFGKCDLAFDHSLLLPKNGTIEVGLSAHSSPLPEDQQNPLTVPSYATILFQTVGGLFGGAAVAREVLLGIYTGQPLPGIECWPYSVDFFGGGGAAAPALPSPNWWPPVSRLPAGGSTPDARGLRNTTYAQQEATRSGSTEVVALRTYIDQMAEDQAADEVVDDVPCSPLSMRTGCQVRTVNGGSGHNWWRPGAPLALVLDTCTPAVVLELPEPITLLPGEQLDAEVEVPANIADQETTFRLGVSFNGFAEIEG